VGLFCFCCPVCRLRPCDRLIKAQQKEFRAINNNDDDNNTTTNNINNNNRVALFIYM
jgi:hypothetical protein